LTIIIDHGQKTGQIKEPLALIPSPTGGLLHNSAARTTL
jgi:hypothetical protein